MNLNEMRKCRNTISVFIYCLIVEIIIGVIFLYLWSETLKYRIAENMWKDILNAYNKVIPQSVVEKTIERLNPEGYWSYGQYEDAVWIAGPDYDFPKVMHFRNSIRFRKEFLRGAIEEINKKMRFIDENLDHLRLVDRWYYWKLKKEIKKGNNGLISQTLLDTILDFNFDQDVLKRYGFEICKEHLFLWAALKG